MPSSGAGMRRFVNPTAGALLQRLLSDAGAVDVHTELRVLNITAGHGAVAIRSDHNDLVGGRETSRHRQ
jgi:hypothetical protein